MRKSKLNWIVGSLLLMQIAVICGLIGGFIYVAMHFILKLW